VAILITRPAPDDQATAEVLRAKGHDVLRAPMLRYEPVAFQIDPDLSVDALLVTSANALRALAETPMPGRWRNIPLFAVGDRTARAARAAGFERIEVADGDGASLRDLVVARMRTKAARSKPAKKPAGLLYLAAADRAVDLGGELEAFGFNVVTVTTYRMIATPELPAAVCDAFSANRIEAVLHYSRRSGRAFIDAVRAAGVEISALAVPHCCISDNVASVVRDAGASQVAVAQTPDENALFDALGRALRPQSR